MGVREGCLETLVQGKGRRFRGKGQKELTGGGRDTKEIKGATDRKEFKVFSSHGRGILLGFKAFTRCAMPIAVHSFDCFAQTLSGHFCRCQEGRLRASA